MMLLQPKWMLLILAILCLVAMVTAEDKQSPEKTEQKLENVEKRSQEDIMFGNQQNKPAGMVDDLLAFPEGHERKPNANKTAVKNVENKEKSKIKQKSLKQQETNEDYHFDNYDYVPDNSNSQENGYPLESLGNTRIPISSRLPDPQLYIPREIPDYPSDDFDNALYRRKRTPRRPLRKRSLRSNLEDLLGSRHRLPRRASRLKRDAGVEQILNLLEMMKADGSQGDNSLNDANDDSPFAYYYYYDLPKQQQLLNIQPENIELPPSLLESLALEAAAEEARKAQQAQDIDWTYNIQHPIGRSPSIYPVDYRYTLVPGQKKRAPSRHMGRWGKFMNRRLGGESDDDLFALANMLTEEDQQAVERRRRRSA